MPDIYTSDTLILVDPQKVPESYVKSTVTGDVRNRLGTLSQQILSATRLQKIIDTLNLYPLEKKTLAREDVITKMRSDISVQVVSDFGGSQDLQAFRITYSGADPRVVAQVANELASLFIEENLKAREQQASGTTEFLTNQLQETRKTLEEQEGKLRDFRLKHIGEMPEQQTADLQILGQLQSQLQLEGDALNRAEQQRNYVQSMMSSQTGGSVLDLDADQAVGTAETERRPGQSTAANPVTAAATALAIKEKQLAQLLTRGYTDSHPAVRKLKLEIQAEQPKGSYEAEQPAKPEQPATQLVQIPPPPPAPPVKRTPSAPLPKYVNPVLQGQLSSLESEIAKHREQVQNLSKQIAGYTQKLESIPVREQQITELVRDYEISKAHYGQLLNSQLSAETATQLELRQKGEKFTILDPAQPAEKPSRPNRILLNTAGSLAGLILGFVLSLATEFLGMSITSAENVTAISGLPVLEVIPMIQTQADRVIWKKRVLVAAVSGVAAALALCTFLLYHFRARFF